MRQSYVKATERTVCRHRTRQFFVTLRCLWGLRGIQDAWPQARWSCWPEAFNALGVCSDHRETCMGSSERCQHIAVKDNSPEGRSLQCFRSSIRELGRAGRTTLAIGTGKQHVPWSHGPRRSRPSPELQLRGVCALGRGRLRGFVEPRAALGVWG